MWLLGPLLLYSQVLTPAALADVLFRCPPCSPERLSVCPAAFPRPPCAELVRAPGCGCCPVCARLEGESCGVYTQRCAGGLRCYPHPGSELPLQALVLGLGTCTKRRDAELGSSQERGTDLPEERTDNMMVENNVDAGPVSTGEFVLRKPSRPGIKEQAINRERANEQQRSKSNKNDDKKRPQRSFCQLQLDQVLERISSMHLPDDRGPLEHLYALHIPNCDKNGFFNLKQCKMSVNGQRGECWCVNPSTGKVLPGSPIVRGDPECQQYFTNGEENNRALSQQTP
ncbi:hypothetical protein GDO86_020615 [Hymenochirus boettgeri]|uniref:Insulin-like growth factor-binding protein 2 n=1 Tax=Hymenochirus boettgeri TaxID=247094 RepID=A0A8T2ILE7_9PIPI|nr:hypothetical protein GDO86_020615 [Hymenochirus boettgeri]